MADQAGTSPPATLPSPEAGRVALLRGWWYALLVAIVAGVVGWRVDVGYQRLQMRSEQQVVENAARARATAVALAVNRRLGVLNALKAFVVTTSGDPRFDTKFDSFASGLREASPGIRAVEVVRDGVIRNIQPLAGNEEALGADLRHDSRESVRRSLRDAEGSIRPVLSPPTHLLQGGVGLVGRLSVPEVPGVLVAVVFDLPPLVAEADLVGSEGLAFVVTDSSGTLLFGDSATLRSIGSPVHVTVPMPGRDWAVLAVPAGGWVGSFRGMLVVRLVTAGFVLLLALLTLLMVERTSALHLAVRERTVTLDRMNRALSEQVSRRQQVEAQLQQAQKMDSLGRMAGGIAHDFNNLLTGILGYVALLQDELDPASPAHEDLQAIGVAARRASDLTRQLLTFARRQPARTHVFDLNAIVTGTMKIMRPVLGESIEVDLSLDPSLPAIVADPARIEQVITNLVVNARDAMPHGGQVTVGTRRADFAGDRESDGGREFVALEVTDTGTGMDDDVLARAFEPFFTTKAPGKGTGLGLATCYGIARQSGGSIALASTVGIGSTVTLLLPVSHQPIDWPVSEARPPAVPGAGRILLVEDEPLVREFSERVLRARGFEVVTASDGVEALDLATRDDQPFDLLVVDVVMPRLGGRAVAEGMRREHPGLRTLFMSGHIDDTRVMELLESDGVAFLAKPFTPQQLDAAVRAVLG